MKITRFRWVQGAGRRKHILLGANGTETVCGAWYFGKAPYRNPYPPDKKTLVCKHCFSNVGKLWNTY